MKIFKYNWITEVGAAMEIGGIIYILWGIFTHTESKLIVGVAGSTIGFILIVIGFLMEKEKFKQFKEKR